MPETLHGLSISAGLATGSAFVYRDTLDEDVVAYAIEPEAVDAEFARVGVAASLRQAGTAFLYV